MVFPGRSPRRNSRGARLAQESHVDQGLIESDDALADTSLFEGDDVDSVAVDVCCGDYAVSLEKGTPSLLNPAMWCITRDDLNAFEREVREMWENGEIPDSQQFPNKNHDNRNIGPNMYQVNEHYIKPRLQRSGAYSWALSRHEEGIGPCDVFATHAWSEGIFEFCSKVRRVWPKDAKYLYTCFLANPQLEVDKVLEGPVSESPFARALDTARYMIVIPNTSQSIYKRLWCVYEAHLATQAARQRGLKIKLPWLVAPALMLNQVLPGLTMPLLGFLVSKEVLADNLAPLLGPAMWLLLCFMFCTVSSNLLRWVLEKHCDVEVCAMWLVTFCLFELFLVGCAVNLAWWHIGSEDLFNPGGNATLSHRLAKDDSLHFEAGEDKSCTLLAFCIALILLCSIFQELIRNVLDKEAHDLDFKSVRDAECYSKDDHSRIWKEIGSDAPAIDAAITDLKEVGRYDLSVKWNLDLGLSYSWVRHGIRLDRVVGAIIAWQFWWLTDLDGRGRGGTADSVFLGSCVIAFILIAGVFGDKAIFAVESGFWFGFAFILCSNSHRFFTRDAVQKMEMSRATVLLQVTFFVALVLVNLFFYLGYWRRAYDRFWPAHYTDVRCVDSEDSESSACSVSESSLTHRAVRTPLYPSSY
eukprot:TRINITY_DN6925_c0_g3_i1.p1 TRINITY_DN6925_c0_g3~~TRINITY_DN6925_c0_g3_i1.p1  ORF type:complete len:640 (-),score=64.45 TRINITY_DN6925_c0_g3_i1:190-2109(-)